MSKSLHRAKRAKNDEFYTLYEDIEKEVKHYRYLFKDKVVYLPCDDPYKSMFWTFFLNNFEELGIKKLHATCYEPDKNLRGLHASYDGQNYPKIEYLKGDGDFRSDECIKILKDCDIVVTNPPFSLFREFYDILQLNKKNFLIVGNMQSCIYKNVFPYIKNNKVWIGYEDVIKKFRTPDGTLKNFGNVCWFTNLYNLRYGSELELKKKYVESEYKKYANFDAILVDKIEDIPHDYDGIMAVPLSFLKKHNLDQFKIVSYSTENDFLVKNGVKPLGDGIMQKIKEQGIKGHYSSGMIHLYTIEDEKIVFPYTKLFIKAIRCNRESAFNAVDKNGRVLKIGDYVKWKSYCKAGGTIVDIFCENGVAVYIEEHLRDYFQFSSYNSTSLEYEGNVSDVHLKKLLDRYRGK